MARLACPLSMFFFGTTFAQVPTDQAYQRKQQRIQERQAAATTQPALQPTDQIAALQAENAKLRGIIEDLQRQLDEINGRVSSSATTQPTGGYQVSENVPRNSSIGRPATRPANQPDEDKTPGVTHIGPRGGEYHYSKNGNKVYTRHK